MTKFKTRSGGRKTVFPYLELTRTAPVDATGNGDLGEKSRNLSSAIDQSCHLGD